MFRLLVLASLAAAPDGGDDAGTCKKPCRYPGFGKCGRDGTMVAPCVAADAGVPKDAEGNPCTPRKCPYPGAPTCDGDGFELDPCRFAKEDARKRAQEVALDALKGFQKADWGMNEAQVKKLFPGGRASGERDKRTALTLKRDVAGLAAQLVFVFDGGKRLVEARVIFDDQQRGYADWRQVCTAVSTALTERYGTGAEDEEVIQSFSTRWAGKYTLVQLDCSGVAIWPKTKVALFYTERAFEEAQPKVKSDEL